MATLPAELTVHTPAEMPEPFDATRGYSLTRTFPAPRAVVWRAISERGNFARWFGADVEMEMHEWDLREGGEWKGTMTYEGNEMPWIGRFYVVDEPERLVFSLSDEGTLTGHDDLISLSLSEVDGGTELVMVQNGGSLSDEQYEQAKEGLASFLEVMAKVVADLS